jgi:uncharacterized protein
VERHSWLISNRLIRGNVDIGIDHHTAGTGVNFARFVFANEKSPASIELGGLFPVDQLMLYPGIDGTLEYSMVQAGIPAVTTELGGPRGFNDEMVQMGVDGNFNVLVHYGVLPGPKRQTAADRGYFVGNDMENVSAVAGGFVTRLVGLNDTVMQGQKIAIQRDGFGDVVHDYVAPADGRIAVIGTDATTERGGKIAMVLVMRKTCAGSECTDGGITP